MAATMHDYLAQLRLSLRPGTVRNAEATLREFARFLAERDPAVTRVAEIDRRHVEAYKAWLAERPAARGGPLHRHTIRDRLMVLRNFFERLLEWGTADAPARVPLFAGDLPIADQALPASWTTAPPPSCWPPPAPTPTRSCACAWSSWPARACARGSSSA